MHTRYKQLTITERSQIAALKSTGSSCRRIASLLEKPVSAIAREISRNSSPGEPYDYEKAHNLAAGRRSLARKRTRISAETWRLVLGMLEKGFSPEQIAGRLKLMHSICISHERIYQYIRQDRAHRGQLYKFLRRKGRAYKYRFKLGLKLAGKQHIPNRRDIAERPLVVEEKKRLGDYEIDLMVGKNHRGFILTVVDRCSKMITLRLLENKTAEETRDQLLLALVLMPIFAETITCDNGKEFSLHEEITERTGANVYFATPYRSCERGLNEHHNGLVREYLPKKTDFSLLTQMDLNIIADRLNNRPRKVLGFFTPKEIVFQMASVALNG